LSTSDKTIESQDFYIELV